MVIKTLERVSKNYYYIIRGENDTVKIVLRLRFYTIHEFRIATSYLVNVQKSDF